MFKILIFLAFFATTSADDGWLAPAKGSMIAFDLETTALEIKTDAKVGNENYKVYVEFFGSRNEYSGGVAIKFTSPPTVELLDCYSASNFKAFPAADLNTAADNNNVWRVKVPRTSGNGIRVQIYCNNKEVFNDRLSGSVCEKSYWGTIWGRGKKKIKFVSGKDSATNFYRAWPGPTKSCGAPTIDDGKVSPSTAISPGSSYTVTCNGGFTLRGDSEIRCIEVNGQGQLSIRPSCEKELKCGAPTIDNGKVSPSTAISPGSSYTVTCDGGFTVKGNSDVSCTENNGKATLSTSPSCEKDAKDDDKTKLSFANCLKVSAALLVVLITAALLV